MYRRKDTALHWAAYKGHAEVVQALLQAGANPVGHLIAPLSFDASCYLQHSVDA